MCVLSFCAFQMIYADCESIIVPLDQPQQLGQHTLRQCQHRVCSVAYVVVRSDGTLTNSFLHRGESEIRVFFVLHGC